MDQPVDAKEMDFMNCRHQQRQHTQPDPISLNIQPSKDMVPVRETPQHDNFNRGPDWNTDEKAAQEVIDVLAFEPKNIGRIFRGKACVILKPRLLFAPNVKEQLDTTIE